jgi:hypothetical protein
MTAGAQTRPPQSKTNPVRVSRGLLDQCVVANAIFATVVLKTGDVRQNGRLISEGNWGPSLAAFADTPDVRSHRQVASMTILGHAVPGCVSMTLHKAPPVAQLPVCPTWFAEEMGTCQRLAMW